MRRTQYIDDRINAKIFFLKTEDEKVFKKHDLLDELRKCAKTPNRGIRASRYAEKK